MKKTIFNVFLFATGAAVGSLVTWRVLKTKYDRLIQEEIDSVKETFARMAKEESETKEELCEDDEEEDPSDDEDVDPEVAAEYINLARKYARSSTTFEKSEKEGEGDDCQPKNGPELITPEECGDGTNGHSIYCLTYYSDGVLADDWFGTYDIEDTIGEEALEHFGDHVDDVVYVRNESLEADYEVTRDDRKYSDMVAAHPLMHAYAD